MTRRQSLLGLYTDLAYSGVGAGYHIFAGKECSRALAKMSLSDEDCNDKLDDLSKRQVEVLQEWEAKFQEKYKVVGKVKLQQCNHHRCMFSQRLNSSRQTF